MQRLIDRLQEYLTYYQITAYTFEHTLEISNGYLGKQLKGKGAVGSDILEKVKNNYTDLSLIWLVTGKGAMLLSVPKGSQEKKQTELNEEQQIYFTSKDDVINLLNKQILRLEISLSDKDKMISLLETQVNELASTAYKKPR